MNLVNRIWLYHDTEGKICCLGRSTQYRYINEIFEAHEIHHKGKPLKFSQTLCRDTWAIFTYESSGYHVLVTQVALGHQDLTSILHYFDQKSVRNKHRRQFFGFQTHIMTEITQGRINPRILRVLVEKGEITDAEAETLSRGGFRTRQGVLCMNPKSPDAGIDPGHKPGDTCRSQACLDGCSKAYATLDCLEYVACRIIELRLLRDQMPLPAWTSSDYPHDLQFLETLFEMFSEANREAAIKAAECKNTPMIYTLPSKAALVRTK
jgi:hypothetical protein